MTVTWEVTRYPDGDLDEVFVEHARRIVLAPGSPGRWSLVIDLAECGRLIVLFRSVHGIRGTFELDEIYPRCPWLGPVTPPMMPSTTARCRLDRDSRGRLHRLDVEGPNFLHVERMDGGAFWMSMSMPQGELLVSRLDSAARIVGDSRHEPDLDSAAPRRDHATTRDASRLRKSRRTEGKSKQSRHHRTRARLS